MKVRYSLHILFVIFSSVTWCHADTVSAIDLLKRIDGEKPIELKGVSISGDLDFTKLSKKYRGGAYGGRVGRVKEYYTKLRAPLVLEDSTINGAIITFREERQRLLLKENFVAFDAPLVLRRCRIQGEATFESLTFYDKLVIEDCVFEKPVRFEKVHFAQAPEIVRNYFSKGLANRKTNWTRNSDAVITPVKKRPTGNPGLAVTLRNPSSQSVPIQFGDNRWNLSPKGHSTLLAAPGTKVYLTKDGEKKRVLLTITPEIAGQRFDVTRL